MCVFVRDSPFVECKWDLLPACCAVLQGSSPFCTTKTGLSGALPCDFLKCQVYKSLNEEAEQDKTFTVQCAL